MENTRENNLKISDFSAILAWYEAMGVTNCVNDDAVNWFEEGKTIDNTILKTITDLSSNRRNSSANNQTEPKQSTTIKPNAQSQRAPILNSLMNEAQNRQTPPPQTTAPLALPSLQRAKELAASCQSLDDIKQKLAEFDGCALKRTAKHLVFYRGAAQAPLMVIGEAPGRDEDLVGKPFVGKTGALLDRMLKAITHSHENTHITNLVYWRPPGNRHPTIEECQICRPFLYRQIELVNPEKILFLGAAAANHIYGTNYGITKLHGKWTPLVINDKTYQTMATLHPADLIKTPVAKRMAWQDLQLLIKQ